jgi:hypothetical protein
VQQRPLVTIIIATTCRTARRTELLRAVESAVAQDSLSKVVVVVNGVEVDEELYLTLATDTRIHVHRVTEGSLPSAIHVGRSLVETPFFGFLDDDDVLLPSALRRRLDAVVDSAGTPFDVVVSNGQFRGRALFDAEHAARIEESPLDTLLAKNWLASCGGLFRTSSIAPALFEGIPKYSEWTVLAFRLVMAGKRLRVVPVLTYEVFETPVSESHNRAYWHRADACRMMAADPRLPRRARRKVRRLLSGSLHDECVTMLLSGNLRAAWRLHWESLRLPGGLRYLLFTRHLLFTRRLERFAQRSAPVLDEHRRQ